MPHQRKVRVAIIGGGITGLSAAWYLQQAGITSYTVLEADTRWGGKVVTSLIDHDAGPFLIDGGPDTYITRKSAAWDLAHELGLSTEIVPIASSMSSVYVLAEGRPRALPLSPLKFLTSPLMSPVGKLRMLAEPFIPPRRDHGDESLGEFVTRRLGQEALEQFIGPVLGGIYNTDPTEQSIMVTNPFMRSLERDHGSLVKGMLARMQQKRIARQAGEELPPASFTLTRGAAHLIDALVGNLDGDLRLDAAVSKVEQENGQYNVILANGETFGAHGVILAAPACVSAQILRDVSPGASQKLAEIQHSSIGTLTLLYRQSDLADVDYGYGIMIPRRERRRIDAITWPSSRMAQRAPQGYVTLRVFFGGGDPSLVEKPEDDLIRIVQEEIADIIDLRVEPVAGFVFRWPGDYPRAAVGHLDLVDAIEAALPAGVAIAGSSYRGIGVPDCVRQGKTAAETIATQLVV